MKVKSIFVFLSVLLMANCGVAHASLTGDTLSWQYYFQGKAFTSSTPNNGKFVDNGEDIVDGTFLSYFNIIADSDSITLKFKTSGTWSPSALSLKPTIRNGILLEDLTHSPFQTVTIDPTTNMKGFNSKDISFTNSEIEVNFASASAGLSFKPTTIVKLDIDTASTVPVSETSAAHVSGASAAPIPGAIWLLGFGLASLVGIKRKYIG